MVQLSLEAAWKNARARKNIQHSSTTHRSEDSLSDKNSKENTEVDVEKKPVINTTDVVTKDFNAAINYCMELLRQNDFLLKSATNESISRESAILGQEMYDYVKKIKEKMASEDDDIEVTGINGNHLKKVVIKKEEPMEIDEVDTDKSKNQSNNKNHTYHQLSDSEDDLPLVTRQKKKPVSKSSRVTRAKVFKVPDKTPVLEGQQSETTQPTGQNKLDKINETVVDKCWKQIDKKKILTNALILDWAKNAAKDLQDDTFIDEEASTNWLINFKELHKITGTNTLHFEIDKTQVNEQ